MPAVTTAFGITCGSIILSTATVLGIAVLFAQIATAMTIVRLVGAGYLFWLAYKAFKRAATNPALPSETAATGTLCNIVLGGFFLRISNPKAIFFWLAIAGVGAIGSAPAPIILLFVTVAFFNSFAGHGGYALLLSSAPVKGFILRFRSLIESTLGGFFIFAGFKLLTSRS